MKDIHCICLVVALMLSATPARATEQPPPEDKQLHPVVVFLLAESLVAANAGLAAMDPKAYGIMGAVLFPLGAAEMRGSNTTRWVAFAAAEGLAAYNIAELDKDRYTDKEIFVANVVAWHVFVAAVGATGWLKGDFRENQSVGLRYEPHAGGGMLKVAYAF